MRQDHRVPQTIREIATALDVRGLVFRGGAFSIALYRQLPDAFYEAIIQAGIQLNEHEYSDDDRGFLYFYTWQGVNPLRQRSLATKLSAPSAITAGNSLADLPIE